MKDKIDIIIVDDHPIVIEGLKSLLANYKRVTVSHAFSTGSELIAHLSANSCDLILMDINLSDMSGIELCEHIRSMNPRIKIIGISTYNDASIIRQMIQSGARGYLIKNASGEELYESIRNVYSGETYLCSEVQRILAESAVKSVPHLTRREKEILGLIASGDTTPQIAEKLFLSPLTVETHRKNLMQKFSVNNSAAMVKMATDLKLL